MKTRIGALLTGCLLVSSIACNPPPCGTSNCNGCCDSSGVCQPAMLVCGGDGGTTDGGKGDAGTNDAGTNDAGANDAGPNDSGLPDGGKSDGGLTDGGADAGLPLNPQLVIDRDSIAFGREFGSGTYINSVPQQTLSIINGGTSPLTLTGAVLTGPDASAFAVSTLFTQPVGSLGQTFILVTFTPTQARLYSATLTIASNAQNAPSKVVLLSGLGIGGMDGGGVGMSGNNPECVGSNCGSPVEVGGGCGSSASVWVTYVEDGKVLAYVDGSVSDLQLTVLP